MTDFPISQAHSANTSGKIGATFEQVITLFRTACGALAQAVARYAERRAPEEILAAQARREEARRAVDRLLQRR